MKHIIKQEKCISCGTCDVECPFHAILISDEGKFSIDEKKCRDCGICVTVCPVDAALKK
jgi:MinD superfamily P-loop ATPase